MDLPREAIGPLLPREAIEPVLPREAIEPGGGGQIASEGVAYPIL